MDLAMVKQEQGETLRKYMQHFFDKRATVVDVTDKEVIDLFQDGLYHHRTFEDFGRHRPSSITKLKDMITSWADEEDKANAKYDTIRDKSKQNLGSSNNNNNRDQGGRNNNNYSGLLTVKFCQPSHEFTFGVGMSFISYPLVLTPWYNKFTCACRFWSLVFMLGFSVESKTSGISSLSTS
jgi:hypothetical protein